MKIVHTVLGGLWALQWAWQCDISLSVINATETNLRCVRR